MRHIQDKYSSTAARDERGDGTGYQRQVAAQTLGILVPGKFELNSWTGARWLAPPGSAPIRKGTVGTVTTPPGRVPRPFLMSAGRRRATALLTSATTVPVLRGRQLERCRPESGATGWHNDNSNRCKTLEVPLQIHQNRKG